MAFPPFRPRLPGAILPALLGLGLAGEEPAPAFRERVEATRKALADKTGGLNVSAFGDWGTWYDEVGRKRFGFGAAEVDLNLKLGDLGEVSGAFVGTKDSHLWTVYVLDFHPWGGGSVAPRGALWLDKGLHIQMGRFDVPFGNDYQYFASKDGVTVSRPLTTALIMDGGYNDRGLRILGNNGTLNLNAFTLRGFGAGRLYGFRTGFTPFGVPFALKESKEPKRLEVGLSAFIQRAPGGHQAERACALDLEMHLGAFTLVAEALGRQRRPLEGPALWQRGWHVTPQWSFGEGKPTAFARYERVWGTPPDAEDPEAAAAPTTRFCAGLSTTFWGTVQTKVEFQRSIRTSPALAEDPTFRGSRLLLQVVVVL